MFSGYICPTNITNYYKVENNKTNLFSDISVEIQTLLVTPTFLSKFNQILVLILQSYKYIFDDKSESFSG